MQAKWSYNYCFVWCCFQHFYKTACSIFVLFLLSFFSKRFIEVQLVLPYHSTDMAAIWKNSCFISSERLDFYMVNHLLIAVYVYPMTLKSLSVDEILILKYMKWSTKFRGLSFVLSVFTWWSVSLTACSRFCRYLLLLAQVYLQEVLDHLYCLHQL